MNVDNWSSCWNDEESMGFCRDLARVFLKRLKPYHPLQELYRLGQWEAIAKYPQDFTLTAEEYYNTQQVIALFKKAPFLPVMLNPERAAIEKFVQSEVNCRKSNTLFEQWKLGRVCIDRRVAGILHAAAEKISFVLGEVPNVGELPLRFTSGASVEVKKKDSSIRNQLMADLSCSEEMYDSGLVARVMRLEPTWLGCRMEPRPEGPLAECVKDLTLRNVGHVVSKEMHVPHILDASRNYGGNTGYVASYCTLETKELWVQVRKAQLEFAPKTAFEHRTIVKDPPLNKYVQVAYGDVIRERLKHRCGIDIQKGQQLHRELARRASLTGDLATLDQVSASNNICRELVQFLLPHDWFYALQESSTSAVVYQGLTISLAKMMGEGNGFTFPLQTLIFWALCKACVELTECSNPVVSVYGDDVICPIEAIPQILRVFSTCGFEVNQKKSFWEGPFRESCGGDWYIGVNVRPIYVKEYLSLEKLYILHNAFYRRDDDEACERILSYIQSSDRIYGPEGFGDGHLLKRELILSPYLREEVLREWDPVARKTIRVRDEGGKLVRVPTGYGLTSFKTVASKPVFDWNRSHYDLACILYEVQSGSKHRVGTDHRSRASDYQRELDKYLSPGMSISEATIGIQRARNANMRNLIPDQVLPTRQRKLTPYNISVPVASSDHVLSLDDSEYVIGMPLPGSDGAQVVTICVFG